MTTTNVIILVAFAVYMLIMIAIGFVYSKRTKNNEDYFLGGRNLGGWTAALSAQASDMSGWLLMGLPGSVYLAGTGEIWIAIGLLLGTILNWYLVSSRLRKYTIVAGNSLTIPSFFQNRYRDSKGVIKIVSAIIIAIFFAVYTASAFSSGAKLFATLFGNSTGGEMDKTAYLIGLIIASVVILVYTFWLQGGLHHRPDSGSSDARCDSRRSDRRLHGAHMGSGLLAGARRKGCGKSRKLSQLL